MSRISGASKTPLAVTVLAALLSMFASPAVAQIDGIKSIQFHSPGAGQPVSGMPAITVQATSELSGMIKSITISIRSGDSQAEIKRYAPHDYSGGVTTRARNSETVSDTWDTKIVTPRNGIYDVLAQVEGGTGINSESATLEDVKVNNAPVAPGNLSVTPPEQGKPELTVSWAKNPEPDITGYKVFRAIGDEPFDQKAYSMSLSYSDEGLPFDQPIRYQVIAFRNSPVSGVIGSTAASTAAVSIPAPPPPPSPSPSAAAAAAKVSKPGSPSDRLGDAPKSTSPLAPLVTARNTPPERIGISGGTGFNRLLPFGKDFPKSMSDLQTTVSNSLGRTLSQPGRLIGNELRQNPVRFMALGVLLLVAAGHLAGAARRILATVPESAPTSSPALATKGSLSEEFQRFWNHRRPFGSKKTSA